MNYDPDEDSYEDYLEKVDQFKIQLNKSRYNAILDFLNSLLMLKGKQKYTRLSEFKNISSKYIFHKSWSKLFIAHCDPLFATFGFKKIKKLTETSLITLLRKSLTAIDYKLISHSKDDDIFYSIKIVGI